MLITKVNMCKTRVCEYVKYKIGENLLMIQRQERTYQDEWQIIRI